MIKTLPRSRQNIPSFIALLTDGNQVVLTGIFEPLQRFCDSPTFTGGYLDTSRVGSAKRHHFRTLRLP